MGQIKTDVALRKTLQFMRKSDAQLTGILARSTVVWVSTWKPDANATVEEIDRGAGEWANPQEGPLFICSRSAAPHYRILVTPRSQGQKVMSFDITSTFIYQAQEPRNLQLAAAYEDNIFNFTFPGDTEGIESFKKVIAVIDRIQGGEAVKPMVTVSEEGATTAVQKPAIAPKTLTVNSLFAAEASDSSTNQLSKPDDHAASGVKLTIPAATSASHTSSAPAAPLQLTRDGSNLESQPSAKELIDRLTSHSGRLVPQPPAPAPPPAPPPPAATLLKAATNPSYASKQQASTPSTPARAPVPSPHPHPPPTESPDPSSSNIMASLFGNPQAPATTKASVSPCINARSIPEKSAMPPSRPTSSRATVQPPTVLLPKETQASVQAKSTVQPMATDQQPATKGSTTGMVLMGAEAKSGDQRARARALLEVLSQDDRFIDALADAMLALEDQVPKAHRCV